MGFSLVWKKIVSINLRFTNYSWFDIIVVLHKKIKK